MALQLLEIHAGIMKLISVMEFRLRQSVHSHRLQVGLKLSLRKQKIAKRGIFFMSERIAESLQAIQELSMKMGKMEEFLHLTRTFLILL